MDLVLFLLSTYLLLALIIVLVMVFAKMVPVIVIKVILE